MFKKDLLLIDLETTGVDPTKHEIIQLAAILLDKKTLKEKRNFVCFVKPKHWARRDPESVPFIKFSLSTLNAGLSLKEALKDLQKSFPKLSNLMLANYGGTLDIEFLKQAYRNEKLKFPFDYHLFNIWILAYTYRAKKKKLNNRRRFAGFSMLDLANEFKIPVLPQHDALNDCKMEAEILRHLVKKLKF